MFKHFYTFCILQVEYRPCVVPESCWDLLMEFMQGVFGQQAQTTIPRALQVKSLLVSFYI